MINNWPNSAKSLIQAKNELFAFFFRIVFLLGLYYCHPKNVE